jgi:hypothetical protein
MWGFASPLIGDGSSDLLRQMLEHSTARGERVPLLLTGVPASRSRLEPLIRTLAARHALRPLAETVRLQASLEGGVEGWLARRFRFGAICRAAPGRHTRPGWAST